MAENYRFFDATTYTEAQFAEFMKKIMAQDGYLNGVGSELAVIQHTPADMIVIVGTGEAWIQGAWYQNTAAADLAIEAADASWNRIDRVVIRVNWTANTIAAAILKGTKAASPTAPALTQSASVWELSLAQVAVGAGETEIHTADITDERLTTYCGVAGCRMGKQHVNTDGTFDFGSKRAENLTDPNGDQDAETKKHVADTYAPLASPTFTGTVTLPADTTGTTAAVGTSDTKFATTAFVHSIIASGTYTGDGTANRAISHGIGLKPKAVLINGNGGDRQFISMIYDMTVVIQTDSAGFRTYTVTDASTTNFYVGEASTPNYGNRNGDTYKWVAFG